MQKLTDKQEKFVQELIKGKSQREAYKIAYPNCKAKDKTIDEYASRLMKTSKVSARYNEIHDKIIQDAENECIVNVKEVLSEIKALGFSEIRPSDKLKALELLGRHLGMFTDKHEIKGSLSIENYLEGLDDNYEY